MLLELSEVFVCPRCRPVQGMVVMVDRLEGRRVLEGRLGCPSCDLRVPIRGGTLRFDRARLPGEDEGSAAGAERDAGAGPATAATVSGRRLPELLREVDPGEAALRLAALAGADAAEGYLLLGPGLAGLAAGVAARAPDAEVLALADDPEGEPEEGVARAVGIDPAALPLVTGRMAGAALSAPRAEELEEAVRVLGEDARLAVLAPGPSCREILEELPVRVATAEDRAVVAVREPGGFDAPFARFPGGPRPRSPGEGEAGPDGDGDADGPEADGG